LEEWLEMTAGFHRATSQVSRSSAGVHWSAATVWPLREVLMALWIPESGRLKAEGCLKLLVLLDSSLEAPRFTDGNHAALEVDGCEFGDGREGG
jgi:hypothetical protein